MIAQYPGLCAFCSRPIAVGIDTYDKESRKNWHEDCYENQPPSAEQYRIADECGYIPSASVGGDGWASVCQDWILWSLSQVDLRSPARGIGLQARGRNGDLFGEE